MEATALRKRLTQSLLDDINEVQFPSVTMMNRIEAELKTREQVEEYAEILLEKVKSSRFPSISMLDRIDGAIERLG
jgi:hypothetical protein